MDGSLAVTPDLDVGSRKDDPSSSSLGRTFGSADGEGFRVRIGGGPRAAGRARNELSRLRTDLDSPLLESVRLLVTELVTNSVRHAGAASIDLLVVVGSDRIRVEVSNQGASFSADPDQPTVEAESGWGLFLVKRLSDAWGVTSEPGAARVWFEIRRSD